MIKTPSKNIVVAAATGIDAWRIWALDLSEVAASTMVK
jgi:hypothetical protein